MSANTPMDIDVAPLPALPMPPGMEVPPSHATPMAVDATEKSAEFARARQNRLTGRANAREANAQAWQSTGVEMTDRDRLKQQSARERELEQLNELDEAADHENSGVDPTSQKAKVAAKRSVLMDSIGWSEADQKYLDEDTISRTKHNKRMRALIKEGMLKQERYIRKHMAEFRPFLNKKMRKKYEGTGGKDEEEDEKQDPAITAAQQAANQRAGEMAAQLSALNPEATRVTLPASSPTEALTEAHDLSLPQCKVFTKQPPYIVNGTMREYQIAGLNWLITRHENCVGGILGDEMGLGKSLQTISFLAYLKYERGIAGPHLIVAPLSVLSAWMAEFKRWCPGLKVVRYHGPLAERRRLQNDDAAYGNFDVILTTYEMIVGDEDYFRYKMIWQYVVVDEAHRIKNEKTLQAQALASIQRYNVILLSGTPTQNNTHEIWALLHFLLPKVFTSSEPFDNCFNLATSSIDQEQLLKIHTLLKPLMLRRVKAEMQQKLPPKTETKIFVGLTELQREWYRRLVSKDISLLLNQSANGREEGTANALSAAAAASPSPEPAGPATSSYAQGSNDWRKLLNLMMNLRKICNHPFLISGEAEPRWDLIRKEEAKEDAARIRAGKKPLQRESIEQRAGNALIASSGKMQVLDKLLTKLKSEGGHRVLLFSLFTRVLDLLEDFFAFKGWPYLRLDGSTNRVRRSVDIRRFNDPNSRFFVYLISTRAGGLGINLTGADTVVHFDSDFNPQVDLQAQDRCHRIGQTKPVNVYRFITENTVEERLIARAEKKLYLDMMVNRQSHISGSEIEHLASEQEELTKLSKDEMLSMLMFGASRIFKATGPEQREEDIEAILTRSKAKDTEDKQAKINELIQRRAAALAANAAANADVAAQEILLDDEGRALIEKEKAELAALNPQLTAGDGDVVMGEEKTADSRADTPAAAATPTKSSNIIENAQMTMKNFAETIFDGKGETPVHVFEGTDFSQVKKSKKELLAQATADLIVEDGKKRERKQRLVTIEDSRGRNFQILATQASDIHIREQGKPRRKRGRPPSVKPEVATPIKTEASTPDRRGRSSKNNAADESESESVAPERIEPKVIGHEYAINWSKSKLRDAKDLEKAVKALNDLDKAGEDVTESKHKLSLWITKSEKWNMTKEERIAYERKLIEEQKQMIALRDAKRRRWQEGAPEEDWYNESKLDREAEKKAGGPKQVKAANGEYVYNNKYVHEDWCHLCKLGGDLLCCGYCPRTFHLECVGLTRAPGGYFSCPQHKCAKCERNSQEAGGMLFRCVVCPCSYCEDDVPSEYEGRRDLDRCFELEMTGYRQPSSAFFITCSQSCTKYYQDYLDGKYIASEELNEPIPIDLVNKKNFENWKAEVDTQTKMDEAAASTTKGTRTSARKAKTENAAAASSSSAADASSAAAAAAAAVSPSELRTEEFFYQLPKEIPPHICSCLIPKKQKPKLYCICRTPYDKRRNYLACDGCGQWYHLTCVGMKEDADVETIEWTCKACQLKDKQKASKQSGAFEIDSDAEASSDGESSEEDSDEEDEEDESGSEPDEDDEAGGITHEEERIRRKNMKKKPGRRGRPPKEATPSRGRNSNSTGLASLPNTSTRQSKTKKQKVHHPVDGGATSMATAPSAFPAMPSLEQAFAMNMQLMQNQAATGAATTVPQLDQATFQQMMQFFGSSGQVVGADGRVHNTGLAFPTLIPSSSNTLTMPPMTNPFTTTATVPAASVATTPDAPMPPSTSLASLLPTTVRPPMSMSYQPATVNPNATPGQQTQQTTQQAGISVAAVMAAAAAAGK